MSLYAGVTILTELFMLAMAIHVMHCSGIARAQKRWFLLTFFDIMLCAAAEFAVHCGVYAPRFALALTLVTVLQLSLAPLLGILFSGALGLPRQKPVLLVFLGVNLLVEAVAAPFGWIFRFDAAGYARGPYFIVYGAFYVFSLVYLTVSMVRVGWRFMHRDRITIVMILVVLATGILPMTLYRINVTYMAVAMGASLSYIYYNDLVQQDTQAAVVADQARMAQMQEHIISGLANLIENRDLDTGEHVARTSSYVKALTQFARADGVYANRMDDRFVSLMTWTAPLHDVGKIVVPDHILKKPGKLTPEEFEEMKLHASEGGRVVQEVLNGIADDTYLAFASDVAACHHERWDGSGYPDGVAGESIPLPARVMAIVDVFDALISDRCYKKGMLPEKAFEIIEAGKGTQFDPMLTTVFLDHKDEFVGMFPKR